MKAVTLLLVSLYMIRLFSLFSKTKRQREGETRRTVRKGRRFLPDAVVSRWREASLNVLMPQLFHGQPNGRGAGPKVTEFKKKTSILLLFLDNRNTSFILQRCFTSLQMDCIWRRSFLYRYKWSQITEMLRFVNVFLYWAVWWWLAHFPFSWEMLSSRNCISH